MYRRRIESVTGDFLRRLEAAVSPAEQKEILSQADGYRRQLLQIRSEVAENVTGRNSLDVNMIDASIVSRLQTDTTITADEFITMTKEAISNNKFTTALLIAEHVARTACNDSLRDAASVCREIAVPPQIRACDKLLELFDRVCLDEYTRKNWAELAEDELQIVDH